MKLNNITKPYSVRSSIAQTNALLDSPEISRF